MQAKVMENLYEELADVKNQVNELTQKMDAFFNAKHEDNKANIDYIAMMTDVDIPTEDKEDGDLDA